jgi:HEAT repeat protein
MSFSSVQDALTTLGNSGLSDRERQEAMVYLSEHPAADGVAALIAMLETDEPGLRWEAGEALAKMGKPAVVPLLSTLVSKSDSTWLREGAYHAFHDNRDASVVRLTEPVRKALKGLGAPMATTTAAGELMLKLQAEGW